MKRTFTIVCSILLLGCNDPPAYKLIPPRYGMEWNGMREELGIPLIPENSKWENNSYFQYLWGNEFISYKEYTQHDTSYYHFDAQYSSSPHKDILYTKDTILYDITWYIGKTRYMGREFNYPEGESSSFWEELTIACIFQLDSIALKRIEKYRQENNQPKGSHLMEIYNPPGFYYDFRTVASGPDSLGFYFSTEKSITREQADSVLVSWDYPPLPLIK